jgi:23S rRNA pseudouridine1911/1915/1917 synthase
MAEERLIPIADEDVHERLDVALAKKLPEFSRSQLKKMIENGLVRVNERATKAGYLLKPEDVVCLRVPAREASQLSAENIPLDVVYEDEDLVVVDKPAGLVVHTGAGIKSGTLVNALLFHFRQLSRLDADRPGIVHRLDKLTSGLVLVAKNEPTHRNLVDQFKARKVKKEYVALVYGALKNEAGTIDLAIGRDPMDRTKMSPRARRPRTALTHYQVLERLAGFTLLRVRPHTGRTHQIRVHLSSIGHPIVGDDVYGSKAFKSLPNQKKRQAVAQLGRYFLHATALAFTHPRTGLALSLQSPLPPELENLLALLR